MRTTPARPGRVAVIGAGPAGMATALSVHQAGHDVILLERYPQARPAGNILNPWPPPVKALDERAVAGAEKAQHQQLGVVGQVRAQAGRHLTRR